MSIPSASTYTGIATYATGTSSSDGTITVSTSTGAITIYQSGLYQFNFQITYDSNLTGTRSALIQNLGASFPTVTAALSGAISYRSSVIIPITVTTGSSNTYYLQGWSSVASRSITDSQIAIVRH